MKKRILFITAMMAVVIVKGQNVGIGTTAPATKLHIVGNSALGVQHIRLEETESDFSRIGFHNSVNTKFWDLAARSETDDNNSVLNFYNSSTGNLVSIIGNGNVGIGNTNPVYKLDVAGRLRLKHSTGTAGIYFDGVTLPTRSFIGTLNDSITGIWGGGGTGWNFVMNVNNGHVGIGTTAPQFPLDFANQTGGKISFWNEAGNNYGIGLQPSLLQIHTAASVDDVAFGYGSSAAFTETMRIKGNGRVGIGTSTPAAALDVHSSVNLTSNYNSTTSAMYNTYSESGTVRGYIGSYTGAAEDFDLGTTTNNTTGKLHFTTQATPKMTIDNTGNIGIGTTTPAGKLHVLGNSSTGFQNIKVEENQNDYARIGYYNSGTTKYWETSAISNNTDANSSFNIYNSSTGNLVTVSGSGNVGIGNTAPQSPLSFANSFGNKVSFWNSGINNYGIGLQSNLLQFYSDFSGADIAFGYGSSGAFTENMRIKGNGNVGIGTTNPTATLEVDGYTKMGSDAPAIKTKFLTRTITTVDGSGQSINHGLHPDRILSLTVQVTFTSTEGYPSFVGPNNTASGLEFSYTNVYGAIQVFPKPGNSSSLLNQTMKVFIVYKDL